ncbi:hypothetical protein RRF57_008570 [Xylaria bambusicola]|uniref:Uncharacterized protein n=1 Tax=Xylaria bambusicola TaxID=326684 RepID=A0AAN7ZB54_9PEZI
MVSMLAKKTQAMDGFTHTAADMDESDPKGPPVKGLSPMQHDPITMPHARHQPSTNWAKFGRTDALADREDEGGTRCNGASRNRTLACTGNCLIDWGVDEVIPAVGSVGEEEAPTEHDEASSQDFGS